MKQKINILLFIKFTTFILLCCICHFYIHVSTLKLLLEENCNNCKKFPARNYRLLSKYKKNCDSNALCLKEELPTKGFSPPNDISTNKKDKLEKNKKKNGCSSMIVGDYKPDVKNKTCIFETKEYSNLEKKIFKELDYTNFLKNNRTISNKVYRKLICKKYGLRIILPVLFFLFLLIIFILEVALGYVGKTSLLYVLGLNKVNLTSLSSQEPWKYIIEALKKTDFLKHAIETGVSPQRVCELCSSAKEVSDICILGQFFRILIYFVPFIIMSITIISRIIYYHKKVKKYEKIKLRKR
ncbi:fam-l protein [Plasmodium brasilianum]|uniref:Fam-l protein n=1 Tax=Plasmodium brasilianum TaxID=5824 RepID=A0ACB9Y9M5_PLABR|nr:fam-l protein [Plasmodium brasilianum]